MDFHNPKVETTVIEHIRFADRMVTEAIGPAKCVAGQETSEAIRQQMVIILLTYTLNRDYRLSNTLAEIKQSQLPIGQILEDNIL